MKSTTERDMTQMKSEFSRVSRNMHSSCLNLGSNLHSADVQNQVRATENALHCLSILRALLWCFIVVFYQNLTGLRARKAVTKKVVSQNGRESTNKIVPSIPSNFMIGRLTTFLGTAVLEAAFLG